MVQTEFTLHPIVNRAPIKDSPTEKRFESFHKDNPHVYDAILRIVREQHARGWKHGSIELIFNRLRWLYAVQTQGDEYRLNNNYKPFYARKLMAEYPEFKGFFNTRNTNNV